MTFSDIFGVVKELVVDWRLITTFIVVFLYLNFVFYVSKYKKKQNFKPKRVVKQSSAETPPSSGDDAASSEGQAEDSSSDGDFV